MVKTSKINQIAIDKTTITCYNTSMKNKNNNTNTTLTKKGKFNMRIPNWNRPPVKK